MLYEIYCDKFIENKGKENETPRGRIRFDYGLNVVQGENSGKNSIGKSSFLLAVDFAFGGDDYAKDDKITSQIGHHIINFCYEFDNEKHYFSRSTEDSSKVCKCDENYVPSEVMTIYDFRTFLLKQYQITLSNITFRGVVSLFFRIYGRDTVKDHQQPLTNDTKEPTENSLILFLKLYSLYAPIEQNKKQRDEKERYKKALLEADNHKVIKLVTAKGYADNIQKLNELQIQLDDLALRGSIEITTIDEEITQQALEYKAEHDVLSRQRRILWAKWHAIDKAEKYRRPATQDDFDELIKYFPNSNVKDIAEIENFHRQLSSILQTEFKNGKALIVAEVNAIDKKMLVLEQQMQEINLPQQISKKTLKTCGEIYSQMTRLQNENSLYDEKKRIDTELKNATQVYTQIFMEQFGILQTKLNTKLVELNSFVYGNNRIAPALNVLTPKTYKYETLTDGGTGTNYKNLILLDLATLDLTELPTLIHDTVVFKNIDKPAMGKLIELYQKFEEKQVFIAFDETSDYPDVASTIIKDKTRIKLSYGGGELFGWSWNEKTDTEKE